MEPSNPGHNGSIAGALTYPVRREEDAEPIPVQPRQPRNLQGLLRFAMEATKAEDAPGNSQLGPMDDERRKFLEEAFKSLTVDIAQVIRDALKVLTDTEKIHGVKADDELPEDVRLSFHNLLELIDDIDISNDFFKMGGFAIFPVCYGSPNAKVRAKASAILAECCQNNPFCQARALECGLLSVLLNLMLTERGQPLVKCVYAVSCCVREFEPACKELISQGGCAALAQVLNAPEQAARTKAAFLITYLCRSYDEALEQFVDLKVLKTIGEHIKAGRDDATEQYLALIQVVIQCLDQRVFNQCYDPALNLKEIIQQHLKHEDLKGDDYIEEKTFCEDILLAFSEFEQTKVNDEIADR